MSKDEQLVRTALTGIVKFILEMSITSADVRSTNKSMRSTVGKDRIAVTFKDRNSVVPRRLLER